MSNKERIAQGAFNALLYKRHNARRQEHLASLGLDLAEKKILEVGAGAGDHSHFFVDRACPITITEAREENLNVIRKWVPTLKRVAKSMGIPQLPIRVQKLDLDNPDPRFPNNFDIIYCYGVLYHLKNPAKAIAFMSKRCKTILLETCVSFGEGPKLNPVKEKTFNPTQSFTGMGCRPTRKWVCDVLKKHFTHVYVPTTQPWHAAFPIDWDNPKKHKVAFTRAVFLASKTPIDNQFLLPYNGEESSIPRQQKRY